MTDDQQIQEEGPMADARRLEPEITARVKDTLHKLRRQIGKAQAQQSLDRYIRLVAPAFAYHGMGMSKLPYVWTPSKRQLDENWFTCLFHEVSRLIVSYWNLIAEGEWKEYESAVERIEEIVDNGIKAYYIAPMEPNGYGLVTQTEWIKEKRKRERRQVLLQRQKEKNWRGTAG